MRVPTSEVGYTSAMPRREDHEVRKGHVGALDNKKHCWYNEIINNEELNVMSVRLYS